MRVAVLALCGAAGCVGPALLGDGTSVSVGTHARGTIRRAAQLPTRGQGYVIPAEWRQRERNFGTDELVELVIRVARRLAREAPSRRPAALLGVGDISARTGGESPEHRSHHSGRDVDLLPFSVDSRGKRLPPPEEHMVPYGSDGTSQLSERNDPSWAGRRFDDARNWLLVRALVMDPVTEVQWIFVSRALKQRLLRYAQENNQPAALVAHADLVMHQPGDALLHNDHFHVRLFCAPNDRSQGCVDRGPPRWLKKELGVGFAPPVPEALFSSIRHVLLDPLTVAR